MFTFFKCQHLDAGNWYAYYPGCAESGSRAILRLPRIRHGRQSESVSLTACRNKPLIQNTVLKGNIA